MDFISSVEKYLRRRNLNRYVMYLTPCGHHLMVSRFNSEIQCYACYHRMDCDTRHLILFCFYACNNKLNLLKFQKFILKNQHLKYMALIFYSSISDSPIYMCYQLWKHKKHCLKNPNWVARRKIYGSVVSFIL